MQKLIVKAAGNMVRLNCKAGGTPAPNITWYREDQSPPKRGLGDIKTNNWSLTLEDSVPNDKGNYTCVVCNIVGCWLQHPLFESYRDCYANLIYERTFCSNKIGFTTTV